jgi:hypothetical protein
MRLWSIHFALCPTIFLHDKEELPAEYQLAEYQLLDWFAVEYKLQAKPMKANAPNLAFYPIELPQKP